MASKYIDFEEALKLLNLDEDSLQNLITEGKIRAFRSHGQMKFREEDIEAMQQGKDMEDLQVVGDAPEAPALAGGSLSLEDDADSEEESFTIELPDEIAADETEQTVMGEAPIETEDSDAASYQTSPTIEIPDEALKLDDEEAGIGTGTEDLTVQMDDSDTQSGGFSTSEVTIEEEAVSTGELTVQADIDEDSEEGLSTEPVEGEEDEDEYDDEDEYEDEEDDNVPQSRRYSRRSAEFAAAARKVSPVWTGLLIFILIILIFGVVTVIVPDIKSNNETGRYVPEYLESTVEWFWENFQPEIKR